MDEVVASYLKWIGYGTRLVITTDEEIVCGRISLRVFPGVDAARAERLVMDFPQDMETEEVPYPMTLKSVLAGGHEMLRPLQERLMEGMREKGWHQEDLAGWRLRFSPGRIEARRLS